MSIVIRSDQTVPIQQEKLAWPKGAESQQLHSQEHRLVELIDLAKTGLVVDCSPVESGSSELIHLLMRVRQHAKKHQKQVVLFNVPKALRRLIGICNLRLALPTAKNRDAAEKLVVRLCRDQANGRNWFRSTFMG